MRLFGLIGYPLSHSFSKKYFADKFNREGITDCRYDLFPLEDIRDLRLLLNKDPEGLNVTIPYKEQVIPFLDDMTDVVRETGACNCIRIRDGKLKGFNTDVTGFEQTLLQKLRPHHKPALVLGTGGASKAVKWVLAKNHIPFTMVSRKASDDTLSYQHITPQMMAEYKLVINTTPLGMYPATDQAPELPYDGVTPDHLFYDLIYNPPKTLFLQKGESKGAEILNGSDMLVIQAEESWRIWNESEK